MDRVLLSAVAALAALTSASQACAQGAAAGLGFNSISAGHAVPGLGMAHGAGTRGGDFRHRGSCRHIHVGHGIATGGWGCGQYGYDSYDGYYEDINSSWRPDSFNDWWHDRPDRAYPRWMARNRDCARPWYSGDALTC